MIIPSRKGFTDVEISWRDLCKYVIWLDNQIYNYANGYFHKISNMGRSTLLKDPNLW